MTEESLTLLIVSLFLCGALAILFFFGGKSDQKSSKRQGDKKTGNSGLDDLRQWILEKSSEMENVLLGENLKTGFLTDDKTLTVDDVFFVSKYLPVLIKLDSELHSQKASIEERVKALNYAISSTFALKKLQITALFGWEVISEGYSIVQTKSDLQVVDSMLIAPLSPTMTFVSLCLRQVCACKNLT